MKKWKRKFCFVLVCIMTLSCMTLSGCNNLGDSILNSIKDNLDSDMLICTAADFEAIKDDTRTLAKQFRNKEDSCHTSNLEVGKQYYLLWQLNAGEDWHNAGVDFRLKSWGNVYRGGNAVAYRDEEVFTLEGNIRGEDTSLNPNAEPLAFSLSHFIIDHDSNSSSRVCIAIPFVPSHVGILYVDFLVGSIYSEQHEDHLLATVRSSSDNLENVANVSIANFTYGVVSQEVYESGQLDSISDVSTISSMSAGRNYLVVDFDMISDHTVLGEFYCGIYLYPGEWTDTGIEQANTAKSTSGQFYGGKTFDFAYTSLRDGTKHARIILGFTVPEASVIDFDFFVYADQAIIDGITEAHHSVVDSAASTLTYRLDKNSMTYHVTGYDTMTGTVVIPKYHEGLPVTAVDSKAFSGCDQLTILNLNKVEMLEKDALKKCDGLNVSDPAAVEMSAMRMFDGNKNVDDLVNFTPFGHLYELSTSYTVETYLQLGKKYYWMVDVYCWGNPRQLGSSAEHLDFDLHIDNNVDCRVALKYAIGPGMNCQAVDSDTFRLFRNSQSRRPATIRLIFEVTPLRKSQGTVEFWVSGENGSLWDGQSINYKFKIA